MAPWAGYTRVSRVGDRAERLISPDLQADRITQYAAGRGIQVALLEPELDVSGGKVERPILSEAIRGIEEGRYAGIIVAQLDRLSRMDITDALHVIRRIESAGGQVIAVAENFDAGTPEGKMARNVILAMGEMQLDRYKAQFRAAKRSAVERGIWPTTTPPYGYTKEHRKEGGDGLLRLDKAKARLVVKAFEARAAGASWSVVADILDTSTTNAGRVIRNRAYLGETRLGEWVSEGTHEPIVSRELWEAAQLRHPRPPRGIHGPSLLAGILRCAGCQRVMSPERGAEWRYRCFPRNTNGRCKSPAIIAASKIEPYVENIMLAHFSRIRHSASQRTRALDRALSELQGAEAELSAYQESVRVSDIGADRFLSGMAQRVDAVNEKRETVGKARTDTTLPEAGTLRAMWPSLSVEERRHVLRGALAAVYVRKGRDEARGRVRLLAAGFGEFPGRGDPVVPLDDHHLEGEIRPLPA